ncbi:alpha/beta hydrolase family protein [Arthrobacter sp. UM1]|uniref:alpha/beta hydrolase family protein n=1 Tax=Arthrobacter sp. UM1 TaxID=2766776 RepID=UPI001CF63295|nr:alpha/beta hydrolase fold domain-containing protein [Arthrobacter sp. UM1]MCB4209199.1 alpha/beta hydrolase fold domain-containing protein [Arthrobacter sp. UM1]
MNDGDGAAREDAHLQRILAQAVLPGERWAYGEHPGQAAELYGDAAAAETLVVFLHGGYFRESIPLDHARPLAAALAEAGAAVALVEYRRAGPAARGQGSRGPGAHDPGPHDPGAGGTTAPSPGAGGHPRTLEDVRACLGAILRGESPWGPLGGRRLVVAGHSAGGSLALSWASWQEAEGPSAVVVALAPVSDLVEEARQGLAGGAVAQYLGCLPDEDLRPYLAEDPRSRAALIPERIGVRVVHGTEDATVDIAFSRRFPAPCTELEGADHFDLIDPSSPHFAAVRRALGV